MWNALLKLREGIYTLLLNAVTSAPWVYLIVFGLVCDFNQVEKWKSSDGFFNSTWPDSCPVGKKAFSKPWRVRLAFPQCSWPCLHSKAELIPQECTAKLRPTCSIYLFLSIWGWNKMTVNFSKRSKSQCRELCSWKLNLNSIWCSYHYDPVRMKTTNLAKGGLVFGVRHEEKKKPPVSIRLGCTCHMQVALWDTCRVSCLMDQSASCQKVLILTYL